MKWLRFLRVVPTGVWAATAVFGALLLCWTVLAPLGRAPDEPAHADLAFLMMTGADYPGYDERFMAGGLLNAGFAYTPGYDGGVAASESGWLTPENAPKRNERRTLDQWGGMGEVGFPNQQPQHPPLYYWSIGNALRAKRFLVPGDETAPLDREWHQLRLLTTLMVLPLPLLSWAAARRLGCGDTTATIAALVPLCTPQVAHIGASINNDNLLVLLTAGAAVLTAGILRGDTRRSTAIGVGALLGLASLVKVLALALVPWVVLAYAYSAWRVRRPWRATGQSLVLVGIPAVLIGGGWPLRNLLRHDPLFPVGGSEFYRQRVPGLEVDLVDYAGEWTSTMVQSFWGDLGWLEVAVSPLLVIAASVFVTIALGVALSSRAAAADDDFHAAAGRQRVYGSLLLLLAVMLVISDFERYRISGRHALIQGRYLFSGLVPFAVLVGWGTARVLRRWAPVALVVFAGLMQLDAVRLALRAWWAEPDASVSRSLSALLAWSPWPEPLLWALGAVTLTSVTWLVVGTVLTARRGSVNEPR